MGFAQTGLDGLCRRDAFLKSNNKTCRKPPKLRASNTVLSLPAAHPTSPSEKDNARKEADRCWFGNVIEIDSVCGGRPAFSPRSWRGGLLPSAEESLFP